MNPKLPKVQGRAKKRRYFTLLLIPNNENSMRKWRVPAVILTAMMVLSVIGIGSIVFFAYGYFAFQGEVEALKFLQGINATQTKQIRQLQEQARDLETKLQTVDELGQRIRSMVGLEQILDKERETDLSGIGGSLEEGIPWDEAFVDVDWHESDLDRRQTAINISRAKIRGEETGLELVRQVAENYEELQEEADKKAIKLEQLLVEVEERLDYLAAIPDSWPLKGNITSTYGWRKNPITKKKSEFHGGLDIAARVGTPVKAAGRGRVVFAGYRSGWGRVLVIDHDNGYQSQYSHNSSLLVKVGDVVEKGQNVARVGNTGRSTGPHLDFRIEQDGELIDPMILLGK